MSQIKHLLLQNRQEAAKATNGVADSLTAGLSTKLREAMWGETATQNHTGGWFI